MPEGRQAPGPKARPRWWFIENVPKAAHVLRGLGVPVRFLTASAFGLPHRRKRVFGGIYAPPLATGIRRETIHTPTASDGKRGFFSAQFERRHNIWKRLGHRPTPEENLALMGFLSADSLHVDELIEKSGLPANRVAAVLMRLELQGKVSQLPGKHFSRRRG